MTVERDLEPARDALKAKDFKTAEAIAVTVLDANPKAHKAYHILSLSAREQNDWGRAENTIQSALEIAPDDPETLNSYGNILSMTMRGPEAQLQYSRALERAPNYLPPALALGQLLLREKNPIEAAEVFRAALQHNPKQPGLMMGLFYALKEAEQVEQAQALLQQLPPSPDLFLARGELANLLDQKPVAEANFIQGLGHGPIAGQSFRQLIALTHRYEGVEAAAARIDEIIAASPEQGGFYLAATDILSDLGQMEAAFGWLDKCVKKFGNQTEISLLRAKMLIGDGEGAAAFEITEAVLKERRGDLAAMSLFVKAALMTERFDVALQASKAAQIRQRNNQFWIAIEALALRGLGQEALYKALYNFDAIHIMNLESPPEYNAQSDFLQALKDECQDRLGHKNNSDSFGSALREGQRSRRDLRFANSRPLQDFFQALARPITDYIDAMKPDNEHPLGRRKADGYRLSEVWADKFGANGYYENHVHPSAWLTVQYFLETPASMAAVNFGSPPFKVPNIEADFHIQPQAGQLLIYPSYMWRGSAPSNSKAPDDATSMLLSSLVVPR